MSLRFAILVPAHNEAAFIERKIRSTHQFRFEAPPAGVPHLALVIDDHSTDGTLDIARRTLAALPVRQDLEWRVLSNPFEPGKGSALRAGFEEAAGYDILAMTDADALVASDAPIYTARAFRDVKLGGVTGTQRYVTNAAGPGPVENRMEPYDHLSEWVRRLESRVRAVFSVHGPWFAVRASTGAWPEPGVGADDLDLAIQVRSSGHGIALLTRAPFWEVKPDGGNLTSQRMRRARAYFEVMDRHLLTSARLAPRPWGALQYAAYAFLPPALALAYLILCVAPTWIVARTTDGASMPLTALFATAAVLLLSPFRACLRLALVILRARFSPHRGSADRWVPVAKAPGAAAG